MFPARFKTCIKGSLSGTFCDDDSETSFCPRCGDQLQESRTAHYCLRCGCMWNLSNLKIFKMQLEESYEC